MFYKTPKIVNSSWQTSAFVWLLAGAIPVAAAWYFSGWDERALREAETSALKVEISEINGKLEAAKTANGQLQQQMVVLEQSAQVDREAASQAQEYLKSDQQSRQEMEKELLFLRELVAVNEEQAFQVRRFSLDSSEDGIYSFRFTISRGLVNGGAATGWVHLYVVGTEDGKEKTLSLKDVSADGLDRIKMRFKHFQDVDGVLEIPEGFEPQNLTVNIKSSQKKTPEMSKIFAWQLGEQEES
ncbi:MAG: hypothetical protein GY934_06070 [Gammaproteobacteria bacterium]|nr:hypothetical protein [Gammaproteobacteria bacterium]